MKCGQRLDQGRTSSRGARGERRQEVHGGAGPHDALVVQGPGFDPLRGQVRSRLKLRHVELLEQRSSSEERAHVRPVELVGGASQEVAAEGAHVHDRVGRVVHGVHEDERTVAVRQLHRGRNVVDRAEGVRGGADGEEPGPRSEGVRKAVEVERARGGIHRHRADGQAALPLQGAPGIHVGVVVELGDDDLVPFAPAPAEGARQVEGQRRHVRAEGDLARRRVQEIGQRRARRGESRVGLEARGVAPVGVGVVVEQIVGHGIDHLARDLGPTRPVEIGDREPGVLALEGGEAAADRVDGGNGHRVSSPRAARARPACPIQ